MIIKDNVLSYQQQRYKMTERKNLVNDQPYIYQ